MVSIALTVAFLTIFSGVSDRHIAFDPEIEQGGSRDSDEPRCWPNGPELITSDASPRRLPKLPKRLLKRRVQRFSVALKICIAEKGSVIRIVILRSSGDKEVDEFFQAAAGKWQFTKTRQAGKPVRTILRVSTVWNPQ